MTLSSKTLLAAAALALTAGAASAADLPRRAAPPAYAVAPPVFTWTGFYAGTLTGYSFTDDKITTRGNTAATITNVNQGRRPATINSETDGLTSIGGGIGYDYQFGVGNGIVVGVTADGTLMDLDRRRAYRSPAQAANGFIPEFSGFRQQLDTLGTVRGRIGYGFDRFLVYGTGGFAFGGVDYRGLFLRNFDAAYNFAGSYSDLATGYAYGGGIEYAIPTESFLNRFNLLSYVGIQSQAVTLKVEYLRYDLGSRNVVVGDVLNRASGNSYTSRFTTEGNLVRGGFTYRFGSLGFGGL